MKTGITVTGAELGAHISAWGKLDDQGSPSTASVGASLIADAIPNRDASQGRPVPFLVVRRTVR